MNRILLAEDDENLGELLKSYLQAKNFECVLCSNGEEALTAFHNENFDLCIFDVMMPIMDGFSTAKLIRSENKEIPIIFLTARMMKADVIEGFRLGADDYITKPFNMDELLFRIEAILRRVKNEDPFSPQVYQIGKYSFDSQRQMLLFGEEKIKLTTKETELLQLLCNNANQTLDRNYALKTIWQDESYFNARSMDVYITRLRKKLRFDPDVQIKNIHGEGFKLIRPHSEQ